MSPIVLRHEELIVILETGKIGYRRLQIENLIERGLGAAQCQIRSLTLRMGE